MSAFILHLFPMGVKAYPGCEAGVHDADCFKDFVDHDEASAVFRGGAAAYADNIRALKGT
jgi:hypothetical protein